MCSHSDLHFGRAPLSLLVPPSPTLVAVMAEIRGTNGMLSQAEQGRAMATVAEIMILNVIFLLIFTYNL